MGFLVFEGLIEEIDIEAAAIIVDGSGGGDHSTIQAAIDAANVGDTIFVWAGTYNEDLIVNKTVTLIGNGTANTTISGTKTKDVILVTADWVNISGFTIKFSGLHVGNSNWIKKSGDAGIELENVKNCGISGNNFTENFLSGVFLNSSTNNTIENNYCSDNYGYGILLHISDYNIIKNNSMSETTAQHGILLSNSNNNTITDNSLDFFSNAIYLNRSDDNKIMNNTIYFSTNGILLQQSGRTIVENNRNYYGTYGIYINWFSNQNLIINNTCNNNSWGFVLGNSHENKLENNKAGQNNNGFYILYPSNQNIFKNNTASNNDQNGFHMGTGTGNIFINNTAQLNKIDGFALGGSIGNKFINNNASYNVGTGIFLNNVHDNEFYNNTVGWNQENGISIEKSGFNTIDGNFVNYNKYQGIRLENAFNNSVVNNSASLNDNNGILLFKSENNSISSNDAISNKKTGIYFDTSVYNTIIENNGLQNTDYGLALVGSDRNSIDSNKFNRNDGDGIRLDNSHNNTFFDNTLDFNVWNGIRLAFSNTNTVRNGTMSASGSSGAYLYFSNGNTIENVTLTSNFEEGFRVERSDHNLIRNNIVSTNQKNGLRFLSAYDNTICENYISDTPLGISLDAFSLYNEIYYNNFIANTNHASSGAKNFWNNHQEEGNYWDDYTGLDNGSSGRFAGDGIGDTNIPHLGLDNYPFVSSSGWEYPDRPVITLPGPINYNGSFTIKWKSKRADWYDLEWQLGAIPYSLIYSGPGTEFQFRNLKNGTYKFRIRAGSGIYQSDMSYAEIKVDWAPLAPTGLYITEIKGSEVSLKWKLNTEPDILGYRIWMNDLGFTDTGPFHIVGVVSKNQNYCSVHNLSEETIYYFVVTAFDSSYISSPYSISISARTRDETPPPAPTGLWAAPRSHSQVDLTWNPVSAVDLAGYGIYMNGTRDYPEGSFYQVGSVFGNGTNYTVNGLIETVTYKFKITAFDEVPNNSSFSNTVNFKIPNYLPPSPPSGLKITNITSNSLKLSWARNPEVDIKEYRIYRSISLSKEFKRLNYVTAENQFYYDSDVFQNTTYYYKLQAIDTGDLESDFSEIVGGTTLPGTSAPFLVDPLGYLEILEDTEDNISINLYKWFNDSDTEKLVFSFENEGHIDVIIDQDSGRVTLKPESNWNGQELIIFTAFDGTNSISSAITINVAWSNDKPGTPTIERPADGTNIMAGEKLDFVGKCIDFDEQYGDELTFSWYSSINGMIGNGRIITDISLSVGEHLITLNVTDKFGEGSSTAIKVIVLEGKDYGQDKKGKMLILSGLAILIIIVIIISLLFMRRVEKAGLSGRPSVDTVFEPEKAVPDKSEPVSLEKVEEPVPFDASKVIDIKAIPVRQPGEQRMAEPDGVINVEPRPEKPLPELPEDKILEEEPKDVDDVTPAPSVAEMEIQGSEPISVDEGIENTETESPSGQKKIESVD